MSKDFTSGNKLGSILGGNNMVSPKQTENLKTEDDTVLGGMPSPSMKIDE